MIMLSDNAMKRALALATVAAISLYVSGCGQTQAQPGDPPPPKVTVAEVLSRDVTEWTELTGRLEAVNTVEVRPRVSGYVLAARFSEGALVRRGDLLFQIDPRPFQAEVDRLKAELNRARATVARATLEAGRAERLSSQDAMSREEHDRRASFAAEAAAQVDAVAAALRSAELNLEFTRITAPISGRVSRAIATEGNLVASGETLLTTIVSLDPIYAVFDVDEQAFLRFGANPKGGLPVRMGLSNDTGFPQQGRLNFVDNRVDPSTGTIRGRAVFANPNHALTPGLFVRLRLRAATRQGGLLVQDEAIGTDLDKRFVYVVTPEKAIEQRVVTLGPAVDDGLRLVRSGLVTGELVVVNGLQRVRPGMKVDTEKVPMEKDDTVAADQAKPAAAKASS